VIPHYDAGYMPADLRLSLLAITGVVIYEPVISCAGVVFSRRLHMSIETDKEVKRWTERGKSVLVLGKTQGQTTIRESSC
jgi:hypothetical protein